MQLDEREWDPSAGQIEPQSAIGGAGAVEGRSGPIAPKHRELEI
jgi:hypothetical protein